MVAKIEKTLSSLLIFIVCHRVLASDYLSSLISGLEDPSNLPNFYLPLTLPTLPMGYSSFSFSSFEAIDCDFPLSPQDKRLNLVFLAIDRSLPNPLETYRCKHVTSSIKGVFIANPLLLSQTSYEEKEIILKNSLLSFSQQFGPEIVISNEDPCADYSFNAKKKACGPENKRKLNNIEQYQEALIQTGTYAGAINLIYTSVQFDQALWNTMVNDLVQEAAHLLEVYPGGTEYLIFCDSNLINNAVVNLFSVSSFVTAAGAENLFSILKYSLVKGLSYAGCPAAPGNFFDAHAAYLSYFRSNTVGYTADFLTKLTNVDDNISNFGKILNENGRSHPPYSETFQSETFGTNVKILSEIKVDLGDSSLCTCSFCVSSSINIKVTNMYLGLGVEAAAVGLRYYVTGTVSQDKNTYFSATLAQVTPDCFEYAYQLPVYTQTLKQWACYPTTLACSGFSTNSNAISFKGKGFAVFQIYPTCADPFEINDVYLCICKPATYPSSDTCANCMAKCSKCTSSASCNKCSDNYVFNPNTNTCSCSSNQFDTDSGCETCSTKCSTCSSLSTCTACLSNYELTDFGCTCSSGYYDTGSGCEKCSTKCSACSSSSKCSACTGNYELNDSECTCGSGYFETGSGCEKCNSKCSTCSSLSECSSCTSNYELKDSACSCSVGYYETDTGCEKCSAKCSACISPSSCSACTSNYELKDFACSCSSGYYETGTGCEKCSTKCSACNSLTICSACTSNYELKGSSCTCSPGYYDTDSGCEKCRTKCSACNFFSACTACSSNYELDNTNCKCSSGFFDTGSGCEKCNPRCSACTSLNSCSVCASNYNHNDGACTCSAGYFDSSSSCIQCNPKCSSCSSASVCTSCNSYYKLINEVCRCEDGKFDDGTECKTCSLKCAKCENLSTCLECSGTYQKTADGCGCSQGFYDDGSGCSKCDSKCSECSSATACSLCNSNYVTDGGLCGCKKGTFDAGAQCKNCHSKCPACTAFNVCTECLSSFEIVNDMCVCPNRFIDVETKCLPICNTECTCNDPDTCDECIHADYLKDETLQICRQGKAFLQAHHIDSLLFDIQLTQLRLTFKFEFTGYSASTDCSLYFTDISALGVKPLCFPGSKLELRIILGQDWTIIQNGALNIVKGSIIIPDAQLLLEAPDLAVIAKYPPNFDPMPYPIISGLDTLSSGCGTVNIVYSSSRSYGVASEKFTYLWSVSGNNVQLSQSTLSSCILSVYSSLNDQVVVLSLTITNFLGVSNSVTLNILINAAPTISAILDYGEGTVVYRHAYNVVSVSIKSRCGLDILSCSYLWTVTPALPSSIALNQNNLKISRFTLQTETTYTLTLQISSSNFAPVITSTTIFCKSSDLIALLDKTDQDVGTFNDLVINGGSSYDPDYPGISGVTFRWNTNQVDYSAVTSSTLTIDKVTLQQFESLTVTLTITSVNSPQRTGSIQTTLKINQETLINVSILPLTKKICITDSPFFTSTIETNIQLSSLTYTWTQTLGKPVPIQPKQFGTCMQIPKNRIIGGAKYNFRLTVSTATTSSYADIPFTVNSPATCKGATISPNSGTQDTEFQIMPLSCSDIDLDMPLSYTYSACNKICVPVKSNSGDPSFKTLLPFGVKSVTVKVTDALLDGNTYSAAVSTTKTRNLKSLDVFHAYKKYKESEEIFVLIAMMIQTHKVPSDLLDEMWAGFVQETKDLPPNRINVEAILRIVRLFIDESQQESFNLERIQKYMNYAVNRLKVIEGNIDADAWESIDQLLNRVLDISPQVEYAEMAFELIKCVMDLDQTSNSDPVELRLERITGLKSTGSVNTLRGKDIKILNSHLEIRSISDNKDLAINVETLAVAGLGSDILKIDIFHCKGTGWGRNCDATRVDYTRSEVVAMMPMWEEELECQVYSKDQRKKCEIIEKNKMFAHVKVLESGVYTLAPVKHEAESFDMVYLICFIAAAGFCFLLAAICWLRPRKKHQSKTSTHVFALKTDREMKPGLN